MNHCNPFSSFLVESLTGCPDAHLPEEAILSNYYVYGVSEKTSLNNGLSERSGRVVISNCSRPGVFEGHGYR